MASTGRNPARRANVFRNLSSGPKTTDGRKTVTSRSSAASTTCSPIPFERRYCDGACGEAPMALTWIRRRTPMARQAAMIA
jgi:hypothetical protein